MNDMKQSVAQIAQGNATIPSFWDYLSALPDSLEAQMFYALMIAGTLGMVANFVVKWAKTEIEGNLICYLFVQNPRGTALSFFTYIGMTLAAIYADPFHVGEARVFVGWGMVLWLGAINGFAIDAIANKGQRPVWTSSEREAKREP